MYLLCKTNRIPHRIAAYTTYPYGNGISLIPLLTRTFGSQGKPIQCYTFPTIPPQT